MEAYIERMVREADELSERTTKLGAFIQGDLFKALTDEDQALLNAQLGAMTAYLSILSVRVARATGQV